MQYAKNLTQNWQLQISANTHKYRVIQKGPAEHSRVH